MVLGEKGGGRQTGHIHTKTTWRLLLERGAISLRPAHAKRQKPRPHPVTQLSLRVELHLHFLIFYFLRKKTEQIKTDCWRRREVTLYLTLNLPTRFFFVVVVVFVLFCFFIALWVAEKKEEKKLSESICLPGFKRRKKKKKQPNICQAFELCIQYYLIISTCENIWSVGSEQS